jgi:hypothetical protein
VRWLRDAPGNWNSGVSVRPASAATPMFGNCSARVPCKIARDSCRRAWAIRTSPLAASPRSISAVRSASPKPRQNAAMSALAGFAAAGALTKLASSAGVGSR